MPRKLLSNDELSVLRIAKRNRQKLNLGNVTLMTQHIAARLRRGGYFRISLAGPGSLVLTKRGLARC